MDKFQKLKRKARNEYRSLRHKRIMLNGLKLEFTNKGWNHVSGMSKWRNRMEITRRLKLLLVMSELLIEHHIGSYVDDGKFMTVEYLYLHRTIRMIFICLADRYIFLSIFEVDKKR